jgi:hypothetical protein
MNEITTPLPKLSQAGNQTDDLVGQLTGMITTAVSTMHRAAALNTGFASAATMLQYATQIAEAVRKLTDTGRDHAEGLRYTVREKVALEQQAIAETTRLRSGTTGPAGVA